MTLKYLNISIIPEGRGLVRKLRVPKFLLTFSVFTFFVAFSALGFYTWQLQTTVNKHKTQTVELESLRHKTSSQESQLTVFSERIEDFKKKLADLSVYEDELRVLAKTMGTELGLDDKAGMNALLPTLANTVAWANNNQTGMGGVEPLSNMFSLQESTREVMKGLHRDLDKLTATADNSYENILDLKDNIEATSSVLAATPYVLPLSKYRLSSKFGKRVSPFGGGRLETHSGLDMPAPLGTNVYAPASGTVLSAEWSSGGYGLLVTIDHGYGLVTRYAHLSKTLVKIGDEVKRGDKIALVGNSGRSTGSHLHYETLLYGVAIDPFKFVDAVKTAELKK